MLLAVDIGNTTTTLGVFDNESLKATWRISTRSSSSSDEIGILLSGALRHNEILPPEITGVALASVVPDLDGPFREACRRYLGQEEPLVVEAGVRTGLRILYDDAREVGADRVVDAVAALHLYKPPLVIVDLGTATVFDAINEQGEYLGGAIAPGVAVAAEALFQRAAKLHRVEIRAPKQAIGRNTSSALESGFYYGYVGLIEGLVERFRRELTGPVTVVATGGFAQVMSKECPSIDVVNPDLTLIGLRLIYEMNRS